LAARSALAVSHDCIGVLKRALHYASILLSRSRNRLQNVIAITARHDPDPEGSASAKCERFSEKIMLKGQGGAAQNKTGIPS